MPTYYVTDTNNIDHRFDEEPSCWQDHYITFRTATGSITFPSANVLKIERFNDA